MASALKNLSDYDLHAIPDAKDLKIGIVVADYHADITFALLEGCHETLLKHGVAKEDITVYHVPGTFELPLGAKFLHQKESPNAVICLGCVIKGETQHDEYINKSVAAAIMNLSLVANTPFIFGVLTPNTLEQAQDRAGGKHGNKGVEAAVSAIKMAALKKQTKMAKKQLGFGR